MQFPPPLYSTSRIGQFTSKDGEEFSVMLGLDEKMVLELKEKSLDTDDEAIQTYTSDRERFGEGSYEKWYSKERTPFALIHDATGKLAALIWFGPKPLGRKSLRFLSEDERKEEYTQEEKEWHTIVYRSYAPFRGKGLMKQFAQEAIEMYKAHYSGARLWAGVSTDNPASLALAESLGFEKDETLLDEDAHWCALVQT